MANYQIWLSEKHVRSTVISFIFGGYKEIFGDVDLNRKINGYGCVSGKTIAETMISDMPGKELKILSLQKEFPDLFFNSRGCIFIIGKGIQYTGNFKYEESCYKYVGRI